MNDVITLLSIFPALLWSVGWFVYYIRKLAEPTAFRVTVICSPWILGTIYLLAMLGERV